jgi:DNA invertase Pin-like site-specific DNA recombinase
LYLGSQQDNVDDMMKKGRANKSKGKDCHNKLTENDIRAIRLGIGTQQNIADQYGVSRSLVGLIKGFKRWSWLD